MNRLLAKRYDILGKIGEGGMAIVYKAKDVLLNRYVAIKILKPEFLDDKKFIENFRHESQAAASLTHPNIVNIYDVGLEGKNINYIVMEYMEGETLSSIIERKGMMSDAEAIDIAKQIASALACAHKNNIIHRDVKPHNILVNEEGVAKITDFGIAKAVSNTTLVASDKVMGSVHYFSPEQARGGYVDGKSDLYSLGIVMYEMVTGQVPFDGDNPVSVAMMHINKEFPRPSSINPNISPALENVIMKATQKIQVDRYEDADDMLAALNAINPMGGSGVYGYSEENTGRAPVHTIVMDRLPDEGEYEEEEYYDEDEYYEDDEYYDDEEYYDEEYEDPEPVPMTKKEMKAEKKAAKKAKKAKKKKKKGKFFTMGRFFGIVLGILLAIAASFGLLKGIDYFTLPEISVPDLMGMDYRQAEALLDSMGLDMEIDDRVYSSDYDQDKICNQDPSSGTHVKEGYAVHVTVSKGVSSSDVPDVIGKELSEAKTLIRDSGYEVGTITQQESDEPEGTVIDQTPRYGDLANPGATIDLVVSTGNSDEAVTMMNLVGTDLESAVTTLEAAGLTLGRVTESYSNQYSAGVVMKQSVEMGKSVSPKKKVNLVVSKGVDPDSGETQVQTTTVPLTFDYSSVESDVFELKINLVQDDRVSTLHDKLHYKANSGEQIKISGSGKGKLMVYYDDLLVSEGTIDFETGSYTY